MAYSQQIYMFLFFLALTACLEIQFPEGRQLKAMKEYKSSQIKIETQLQNHAKQATNVKQILGSHEDDRHINGKYKISPPMTPAQSHEFSSSEVSRLDVLQSTTPGSSPGVGHSFAGQKNKLQPDEQDFASATGKTDGFQPTTPGHSPGVGHSFGNLKQGSNV